MFGISIILFHNCKKVDYSLVYNYIYVNETDSILSFPEYYVDNITKIKILPKGEIRINEITDGTKNYEFNYSESTYFGNLKVIKYGDYYCDSIDLKMNCDTTSYHYNPRCRRHYEVKKIKNNHFELTFRFTDRMLKRAKFCQ